jgi:hypothetical protein
LTTVNVGTAYIKPSLGWRITRRETVKGASALLTFLAFCGIVLGGLASQGPEDLFPGILSFGLCVFFLWVFTNRRTLTAEDRSWLPWLCQLAFLIRVFAALAVYYGPWDKYALGEDQQGYDFLPQVIARYWEGSVPRPPFLSDTSVSSRIGYYYMVTAEYYLLGSSLLVPRIVNCVGGALIVFYSYRLGSTVFGRIEGQVAAVWATFFPSLIIWSVLNMRDIWLALSVLVIIWHALVLRERLVAGSIAVIALQLIWVHYNRSYLVLIMGAATLAVFLVARSRRLGRDLLVGAGFVVLLLALNQGLGVGKDSLDWLDLDKVAKQRDLLARGDVAHSGYLAGFNLSDPVVLLTFVPLGFVYFMFSPFPWQMTVARRLITLPEMLVWYWTVPFVWFAAKATLRERSGRQLALLLPVAVISLTYSITSSNIGLAYRYRAQIIALYLVLAAAGYVRRRVPRLAGQTTPVATTLRPNLVRA